MGFDLDIRAKRCGSNWTPSPHVIAIICWVDFIDDPGLEQLGVYYFPSNNHRSGRERSERGPKRKTLFLDQEGVVHFHVGMVE